ncbi:hypothetical protein ATY41_00105 [Leifsonia xyli subsp. xyli]|uniref:Glycosyltransferase n=2 Tax=Leifsonia xyli subsp. xyli TaxID=59736 RepID=Q6ACZ2_LEIXX|nr:glycosyltransferase [Leifsonia xyli subsp. xyli str. CTCB07]ODA91147.1 hypothetical protein ATY41_00105 [Leifsonia xyli subsp. xyli]
MNPRISAVSVVIPTMNTRGALDDAVASALVQRDVDVEVIVAMNGQGPDPVFQDARVRVVRSEPGLRGNGARMAGIRSARHETVALLDDDDTWEATKLRAQLDALESAGVSGGNWVMSCAILEKDLSTGGERVVPTEPVRDVPSITEYLLERPRLRSVSPQFASSTIAVPPGAGAVRAVGHRCAAPPRLGVADPAGARTGNPDAVRSRTARVPPRQSRRLPDDGPQLACEPRVGQTASHSDQPACSR